MKLKYFCPISLKVVDEKISRFNSIFTILLLGITFLTSNVTLVVFLLFDLWLRSSGMVEYSPITNLSKRIAMLFNVKPKMVNAGSKIFAARIGVVFCLGILIFNSLETSNSIDVIIGIIFCVCALLDAAFNICVACLVYFVIYKLI